MVVERLVFEGENVVNEVILLVKDIVFMVVKEEKGVVSKGEEYLYTPNYTRMILHP